MATLNTADEEWLRDITGNTDSDQPDQLTQSQLNAEYTRAGGDLEVTVVYVLRRLLGLARKWTDHSGETRSESRSQRWEHLKELLEIWERKTGLAGGRLSIGMMNLGLDEVEEE